MRDGPVMGEGVSREDAHPEVILPFFKMENGPCPYRAQGKWENVGTCAPHLSNSAYEHFLNRGFRRMGSFLYRPSCEGCRLCIPIRVNVETFKPTKSQRKTWRKNQDLKIVHCAPDQDIDLTFELYEKYQVAWHEDDNCTFDGFQFSLVQSPVRTEAVHYYSGEKLVGVGWVDRLNSLLSSVYFVFDPAEASRRLGVFSILYEIEYCRRMGLKWLYLGYWVPDSKKMIYKAEYHPQEILFKGQWVAMDVFDDKARANPLSPLE